MNSLDFVPYSLCMELLRGWFKLIIHNKTDYKVFMLKYRVKIFLTFFLQRSFKLIRFTQRPWGCKNAKLSNLMYLPRAIWLSGTFLFLIWVEHGFESPSLTCCKWGKKKKFHIPFGKTIFRKLIDVICLFGC